MCKLCNSASLPVNLFKHGCQKSGKSTLFKHIVFEYTQEYPCHKCISAYLGNEHKNGVKDIDAYIFTRLKRYYLNPVFTKQDNTQWDYCVKHGNKPRVKHGKGSFKDYKTVEKYITQSSYVSYTVQIQRHFITYKKLFRTLEEAQAYKKEILSIVPAKRFIQPINKTKRRLVTVASKGISKVFTPSTGHIKYEIKTRKIYKSFKTLEKAQQFKQEVLNGNYSKHNANIA